METIGALLVALLGAGVGAYFAVIKSQKERLWVDRYETLRDVVLSLGVIEHTFSASHLEQMGVSVLSSSESKRLNETWPNALFELRQNGAKIQLLFKSTDIGDLGNAITELNSSF